MVSVSSPSSKGRNFPSRGKSLLLGLSAVVIWILWFESRSLHLPFGIDILGKQEDTFYVTPKGVVVAYAISITYCHPDDFIADAAAVLQHSIHLVSRRASDPKSSYDYQMVAFVHPDAVNCSQSLNQLGYQVFIKDIPVAISEIRNEELRKDATTTGCCEEKEFLKLYALTLTEYPIVVHLDLDCLFLQPLDHLFDAMMLPDSRGYYQTMFGGNHNTASPLLSIRKHIPDAMWSTLKTIPITSYFVRDYNLIKSDVNIPPPRVNIQGGFWIVQPNQAVFEEFCDILRHGHGYTQASGWGGPQLPPSHYYGVAQIQGLVSYYYGYVRPGSSVELNKCFYNNMVDNPTKRQACKESTSGPCQDCRHTPISQIRSIHLTLCQKPWWCPLWIEEPQCSKFHYEWHRIREDFEAKMRSTSLSLTRDLPNPVNTADMKDVLGRFPRHCTRKGSKGYKPIDPGVIASVQLSTAYTVHKDRPQ
jgi:hypothetical protein